MLPQPLLADLGPARRLGLARGAPAWRRVARELRPVAGVDAPPDTVPVRTLDALAETTANAAAVLLLRSTPRGAGVAAVFAVAAAVGLLTSPPNADSVPTLRLPRIGSGRGYAPVPSIEAAATPTDSAAPVAAAAARLLGASKALWAHDADCGYALALGAAPGAHRPARPADHDLVETAMAQLLGDLEWAGNGRSVQRRRTHLADAAVSRVWLSAPLEN